MKFLKQFLCLVACFVVLSSSFMIGYAADEEDPPLYTADDLIDFGFVDIGDGNFAYTGEDDPFDSGISLFFSPDKNCPDFDVIKDVPWYSFPQYIKDIMYMSLEDLTVEPGVPFKLPFICVQVETNGNVNIWLGINVGLGRMNDASLNFSIYAVTYNDIALENIYPYSCLYRYAFNYKTNKVNLNWTAQKPTNFGNYTAPGLDSQYTSLRRFSPWNIGNQETSIDFYCFGANGVYYATRGSVINIRRSASDPHLFVDFSTPRLGFSSGNFIPGDSNNYDFNYFEYFSPPTYEDYQLQLQEEQNILIQEGNELIEAGNDKLDDILNASGDSTLTTFPDDKLNDFSDAESDLVGDYNPDNLEDDLDIELDSSALDFIWDLFDKFVTVDNAVFTLFISLLSIGLIALILGR